MPEIVADAPVLACYNLFPRLEIEQSRQLGPDPSVSRTRVRELSRYSADRLTGAAGKGGCNPDREIWLLIRCKFSQAQLQTQATVVGSKVL